MGDMEMIKLSTGERTIYKADGTVIKDELDPPRVEFCDKCQTFKRFDGGAYQLVMGLPELWFCEPCK